MRLKTLVFGASLKSERYSNRAINSLVASKYDVVAYGMRNGNVSGVAIETSLKDYKGIDTITMYMNPRRQQEHYDYLIGLQPNRIVFNPGTENPDLFKLLTENNIDYELACTLVLLSTDQY